MMDPLKTSTNQEVVHEGWLIKSPPNKLWKARWRRRWFTLRHSGELPGQYFLEYYTDRRCRKLKGKIDLDQCEQVDTGLTLENYPFVFIVKTPERSYQLVPQNEADMNKWVDVICQVCGLKAFAQDEDQQCQMFPFETQESPPRSPMFSGPYIHISACISGPRLTDTSSLSSMTVQAMDNYDSSKKLVPSPPRSPTTDADSIITDDEWASSLPNVNWDAFPSPSDLKPTLKSSNAGIGSRSVKKSFGKCRIIDSNKSHTENEIPIPPRPPKPSHMMPENPGHNYLNLDPTTESSKPTTPSTPAKSHLNNDFNNSSNFSKSRPSVSKLENNNLKSQRLQQISNTQFPNPEDHIFRYDFDTELSQESTSATYTNLPSPAKKDNSNSVPIIIVPTPSPPLVYRELKPGRKISDSNISNELSPKIMNRDANLSESFTEPPSINRRLKPPLVKSPVEDLLQLGSNPDKGNIKPIPSPISKSKLQRGRHLSISDDDNAFEKKEEIYFYRDNDAFIPAVNRNALQYLDLDLEASESLSNSNLLPPSPPLNTTVYRTVDFVKTEAFNRTKQRVEEERKQCTDELI